jgi:hypothetical protein
VAGPSVISALPHIIAVVLNGGTGKASIDNFSLFFSRAIELQNQSNKIRPNYA